MDRNVILTNKAPVPAGPYSQGIRAGDLIFVAGQIPLDPDSGEVVGEDIRAQTAQALRNLEAILDAAGSSLDRVVKTTVFLTDMANFQAMNSTYSQFFSASPPARSTVQVGPLARGSLIEVEAVALR